MSQDHFSRLHVLLQEFETELARASGAAYGELQAKVSELNKAKLRLQELEAERACTRNRLCDCAEKGARTP